METPEETARTASAPSEQAKGGHGRLALWLWLFVIGFLALAVYSAVRHFTGEKEAIRASADSAIPRCS